MNKFVLDKVRITPVLVLDGSQQAVEVRDEQPAKRRREASPPPAQRHVAAAPAGHQLVVTVRSEPSSSGPPTGTDNSLSCMVCQKWK